MSVTILIFILVMGTIEKGYLGSLIVEKKLVQEGFNIYKPVLENGKVDMIIEKNNIYLKIQIKTVQSSKNSKVVPLRKISHNMGEYKIKTYSDNDIEYFVGVDTVTEDIYMIPIKFSQTYASAISINTLFKAGYVNNFDLKEILK